MATLKDLAQALNLSVMAVSKALRDAPDISEKTKARVVEEARRLNYVPNRAAQNLRSRRTQLFGVLVPHINHSYHANLVWGIERQAGPLGYQLILAHSLDQADQELAEVRRLISRQVEGLLLIPAVRWQNRLATLELLRSANVPAVLLEHYPAGAENFAGVSWVCCEDQIGAETATRHLIELGHRDILFLAGPNGSSASAARFQGYQRALRNAGIEFDDRRVFLAGRDFDSGVKAMTHALSEQSTATAVVSFNDSVALGAVEVLQNQRLRVPEDVSVTGFGDGFIAAHGRVPLTTLRVATDDMGAAAVNLLTALVKGEKTAPRELPVELVVRGSTGKVRPEMAVGPIGG